MLWGAQPMAGNKDLTGWPRALSAGPCTAPREPAVLAAAPLPPPAAAAAPAPAPRPAPAPLRDEGDSGVTRPPQTPTPQTRACPAGHWPQRACGWGTPGWAPCAGWWGTCPPCRCSRGTELTSQSRLATGQLSPLTPQGQHLVPQRRHIGLQPGLGRGDTAAWGQGWAASSHLFICCRSPAPPHRCPMSPSCPHAPGGLRSPLSCFLKGQGHGFGENPSSLEGWLSLSLVRMLVHQGCHRSPRPHKCPVSGIPSAWEGMGLLPSRVPKRLHSPAPLPAPAPGSQSTFPASPGHCSAG